MRSEACQRSTGTGGVEVTPPVVENCRNRVCVLPCHSASQTSERDSRPENRRLLTGAIVSGGHICRSGKTSPHGRVCILYERSTVWRQLEGRCTQEQNYTRGTRFRDGRFGFSSADTGGIGRPTGAPACRTMSRWPLKLHPAGQISTIVLQPAVGHGIARPAASAGAGQSSCRSSEALTGFRVCASKSALYSGPVAGC